ncbi:MAG: DUF5331 domain-containing protein [Xenococcaceae cyanobacterium MO_207.B15]|nr:DUF5331 domain-containing protein [Xenococcaceae cyanobacterium MO_207.B15]
MAKLIEQPEKFKAELKDKWLDYYQANRNWLQSFMDKNSNWVFNVRYEGELEDPNYKPRRPNAYFILGGLTALESQIQGLLVFTADLQTDANSILKALDLDFDPEIELKKCSQQKSQQQTQTDCNYLDLIRKEIKT